MGLDKRPPGGDARLERPVLLTLFRRPFYGWWIVAGAVVSQFTWMGVGPAVVGVFLRPVVDELGWQVWQFTLATSLAAATGAVSGIVAGEMVDRHGPRPLMLLGTVVTTLCFIGLSIQSDLWIFLALYAITGFAGWTLFGALVVNAAVSKWFIAKRGWALAIGSIGVSLAGMISPVTVTFIVDTWDWRVGYVALGVFVTLAIVPAALVMRRTPEDYGMRPDGDGGDDASAQAAQSPSVAEPPSLTRSQALRTRGFWLLTIGFGLNYSALTAILIHAIPFATEAGFSRAIAAAALAVNGLGNLSSKVLWGYGLQRFDPRLLVATAYTISSTGVALMIVAGVTGQAAILFPAFFLYGFGFGGTIPLSEFMWARYFGRAHIGAIRGIGNPIAIVGTGIGPVLAGAWFDLSGDYNPAFIAAIAVYMAAAATIVISKDPLSDRR